MIEIGSRLKIRQIDQISYNDCIVLSINKINSNITQYHLDSKERLFEHCYYDSNSSTWFHGLYNEKYEHELVTMISSVTLDLDSKRQIYYNLRKAVILEVLEDYD